MAKGSSKSTAVIERLLEERRQYEAWIARLSSAEDATPKHVRTKVQADYQARLVAVMEELKTHAAGARQAMEEKKQYRVELMKKEAQAAERLAESELRHAVGEYDEAQWSEVHKDALTDLVSVREELQAVEADMEKLAELEGLVRGSPPGRTAPSAPAPPPGTATPAKTSGPREGLDELAFIKSVTQDPKDSTPSPARASGAHFQRAPDADLPVPPADDETSEEPRTLKCKACGTMNLPTEWYCEQCGGELAAL